MSGARSWQTGIGSFERDILVQTAHTIRPSLFAPDPAFNRRAACSSVSGLPRVCCSASTTNWSSHSAQAGPRSAWRRRQTRYAIEPSRRFKPSHEPSRHDDGLTAKALRFAHPAVGATAFWPHAGWVPLAAWHRSRHGGFPKSGVVQVRALLIMERHFSLRMC
jgi:hypothetical protein